jgi:hypothetical protein
MILLYDMSRVAKCHMVTFGAALMRMPGPMLEEPLRLGSKAISLLIIFWVQGAGRCHMRHCPTAIDVTHQLVPRVP